MTELTSFPVGFEQLHRRSFVNYQLNRAHALGYAAAHELQAAAAGVRTRDDCVRSFDALAGQAESEGRLRNAASYQRIAEFFTPPRSPEKLGRYLRYRTLFDRGFPDVAALRQAIPYGAGSLSSYQLRARGGVRGGTVLLHGGFDSLIEEFFGIWERVAAAGFDVVAFEGPGQGGSRMLGGLTFDHAWEKPVAAVLDHYGIERAALVGISMGGWWALRAAGREPRIDRVVAWPPVYDWLHRLPPGARGAARVMLRQRRFMRWNVRVRTRFVPTLRHVVEQAQHLVDSDDPMDAVDWFLGMNADDLGSHRVTQDVLLLCGAHDAFQPPRLARAQAEALTSARSVTLRTFTEHEHADQHCQMGNLALACGVMTDWLHARRLDGRP